MKISKRLMIFYSILIVSSIGIVSYIAIYMFNEYITKAGIKEMNYNVERIKIEINNMHNRAKEYILFALNNPVIKEYFTLSESSINMYNNIKFTGKQLELKEDIDKWLLHFQTYFNIDEICLIDVTGQEHSRIILSKVESIDKLSSDEEYSSYFKQSFEINEGDVYIAYPYVSPDTNRWVFAYTSPVVLNDGSKPAFLHFEIPLEHMRNIIDVNHGRIYIVDLNGYVILDSENKVKHNNSIYIGQKPAEYFGTLATVSDSREFRELLEDTKDSVVGENVYATYHNDGELHHVVYSKLPMFDWILIYDVPHSMVIGDNINLLVMSISLAIFILTIGSIFAVYILSKSITNPIARLSEECNKLDATQLKKLDIKSNDELASITNSINNLIDKVNSIDRQKEEFSSMITHELKTPLTPIIGWSQALLNEKIMGNMNQKQIKAVNAILSNAERLRRLIGDILDAQKLDLKSMKFDYKEFNVNDMMSELYNNLLHSMKSKNITFTNNTDIQTIIKSDRNRIEQVLNNMVFNAIDFVPENGKIEMAAKDNGNDILFYVKDNGIGIPKDKQANLFKKFYQIDTSAKRKHGGSGLGLAICKGIVEGLGGKIWVESEEGKGSTFYFTIPKVRE
ncbi:MAG: sensor histidine kinase [Candidatus Nitrosocaldaceae archaeon]